MPGRPFPPWFAWFLESRFRLRVLPPATLVSRLPLEQGFVAAELGTGTGVFARAVRPRVRSVAGIDLQRGMLRQARLRSADLMLVQGKADALPLRPASLDLVFLVTVLGELPDAQAALQAVHTVLRPGGWLSVSEQRFDPDYISAPRARDLCGRARFHHVRTEGGWWCYTATFQRGMTAG